MILDSTSLLFIQNVVNTANLAKIDSVIIEPGRVRAVDMNKTVMIFQADNVPTFDFGSIGLNRLDVFTSRFNLAKELTNFSVEATTANTSASGTPTTFIRALTMKGRGTKVEYRCANPATITAPKNLPDPDTFVAQMNATAVIRLTQGISAMGADTVTIKCDGEKMSMEMADVNNDTLQYEFDHAAKTMDGDEANFTFKYPIKTIAPLFKASPTSAFVITARGMLKITINNLTVVVIPLA